ncbi:MAG TPA: cytochrome c biogenesis protein CcsA [Gemmataceae bacterium]|nr:cytochrome c biogenesis protein CcsA [Gemmataceae bacterium]
MFLQGISQLCFGASYVVALGLELTRTVWPRTWPRWLGLAFGTVGLFAHTLYLLFRAPSVATPWGSLLLLSWVLAIFYLYGAFHHRKLAWAIFVLPIVLILIGLSVVFPQSPDQSFSNWFTGSNFWAMVHGGLLLLAAIGVCVGCAVSVMYLVQARRLRTKSNPGQGLKLMSLERLAEMNRRAIVWAFPLLSAGLLVGIALQLQEEHGQTVWFSWRYLGTAGLWLAFLLLLYMRFAAQASNRRLAILTIAVFILLLGTLVTSHPLPAGGSP